MTQEYTSTLQELTELAASLTGELEQVLMEKQASDKQVAELTKQLAAMQKSAELLGQEKVILEKVANHGIVSPDLIPVLGRLESAGFIKKGEAMNAYSDIMRRPDHLVSLLATIADSFGESISEGLVEKQASYTLPEESETGSYVDKDGWSRIVTEGA